MKRPAFQFYPKDWRDEQSLRLCSMAARGLWIDLMCLMHSSERYGHLELAGKPMTADQVARLVGEPAKDVKRWMAELTDNGVCSVTAEGVIFSRRMVRDESLRELRAAGGELGAEHGIKGKAFGGLGGNPKKKAEYNEPGKLYAVQRVSGGPIKVGITKYLSQRVNGIRKKIGAEIIVLGAYDVADMGRSEAAVHAEFNGRIDGEWIDAEWGEVEQVIRGATHPPLLELNTPPLQPPPAFAVASASASAPQNPPPNPPPEKAPGECAARKAAETASLRQAFETWWQGYPKKLGKADAEKAWMKVRPDAAMQAKLTDCLAKQCQWETWKRDGGRFIPHAATWLNGKRWADEADAVAGPGGYDWKAIARAAGYSEQEIAADAPH